MSFNQSRSRGRPKRVLTPTAPPGQYTNSSVNMNTQQEPMPEVASPNYNFFVPDSGGPTDPSYGFKPQYNASPQIPMDKMVPEDYTNTRFAAQLLNEPIVTNMAMQYGNALVGSGKEHIEKYLPVTSLKYYFAVDTDYVLMKLILLFFPFTHKDWSIKYEQSGPLQPRFEVNAPDMYIPTMGFLTYVMMAGVALGIQDKFNPEQLGILASSALAWEIIEMLIYYIILYSLSLNTSLKILDLFAYSSYKYVGINMALITSLIFGKVGYYFALVYVTISLPFFLMRSLKLRVIPEVHSNYTVTGNRRKLYFILFIAFVQPCISWWLTYYLV